MLIASWSSGNAFVFGAGGLGFKSRTSQIEHSVANGSPSLRHFFEKSCAGAMTRRWVPLTRYTLRRNTASIMKDLIWFEMLIEQIIEFELREPGPPGSTCTTTTRYFHDKTKVSLKKSSKRSIFIVKILQEAMYLTSLYQGQISNKI